ncbi:MAG: redoxin domain-containing protein [Acidobacteriia bacterium]|nr:redoxin domain-containing protein [Terriglobia bacterium]
MAEKAKRPAKQKVGAPVEDFTLTSIDGNNVSLRMLMNEKKGAVIVFWSGACSHCTRYDEYLNTFQQRHRELGVAAIASRRGETLLQLQSMARKRRLTFPILHDVSGEVAKDWFVQQTPRAFLIDSNYLLQYRGAIDNYKYPGDADHTAYLELAITELLSGKPLSRTEVASFGCAVESVYYSLPKVL